jgi:hypothetical protein
MVFQNKIDEGVAQLVQSGAGWSRMVMSTVDASNYMGTLVEGVVSPWGPTIVARQWWLWTWVWCIVRTYLDGGNGVGKIPS